MAKKHVKKKAPPALEHLRAPYGKKQVQHLRDHINFHQRFLDAQAALTNAEEQRDLAARILTRIELGHKEGVRSSFELNTAQNQLLEAEGNLIGAQLAWLNAQQRLIASNPQP